MADSLANQSEDLKTRQREAEHDRDGAHGIGLVPGGAPFSSFPASLLGDPRLGNHSRGNLAARSGVMHGAQQTHGNRAVQRFVQRSTRNVPVQRCGPTPCGCSAEEKARHALEERAPTAQQLPVARMLDSTPVPLQRATSIQRQPGPPGYISPPGYTPAPADPNYSRTTGHDAYVGPGDGAGVGGLVSYGCYCGPGGDSVTGSRCGPGAAPKDDIDAQCMHHDQDYNNARVDSGSTPGTHNMFTDLQGWLDSEKADRRLADTTAAEVAAHGSSYSPSALLYAQGIQGIFGGRANVSHGMKWGMGKYDEASTGLSNAYNEAGNWGSNAADEAERGISDFASSASKWSSVGDVASGLAGGASDAANWLGRKGSEAYSGVSGAASSATSWLSDTASQAASGIGEAASGAARWGADTAGAVGNVAGDWLKKNVDPSWFLM